MRRRERWASISRQLWREEGVAHIPKGSSESRTGPSKRGNRKTLAELDKNMKETRSHLKELSEVIGKSGK